MNERISKEVAQAVGGRLRSFRKVLGKTQKDFAAVLDVVHTSYAKYESGRVMLGIEKMHILSTRFRVSLDWLITGKGGMIYEPKTTTDTGTVQDDENNVILKGDLGTDVRELIDHMKQAPLLRHEIMTFMYRFKNKNKELFLPNGKETDEA